MNLYTLLFGPKSTLVWSTEWHVPSLDVCCCCDDITKEERISPILINLFSPIFNQVYDFGTRDAAVKNQETKNHLFGILTFSYCKQKCRLMNLNKLELESIFLPLSLTTGHQFDFYKVITRLLFSPCVGKSNWAHFRATYKLPSRACLHLSLWNFFSTSIWWMRNQQDLLLMTSPETYKTSPHPQKGPPTRIFFWLTGSILPFPRGQYSH